MSGAANDNESLIESDDKATTMAYLDGARVPFYVVLVWLIVTSGLFVYFLKLYLPDLRLWGTP